MENLTFNSANHLGHISKPAQGVRIQDAIPVLLPGIALVDQSARLGVKPGESVNACHKEFAQLRIGL